MKRTALALAIILALLCSTLVGLLFFKVAKANFYPQNFRVLVQSPVNKTYAESTVPLNVITNIEYDFENPERWVWYSLDGRETVVMSLHTYVGDGFKFVANATLKGLSNGQHWLTVYAENRYNSTKMRNVTLSCQARVYFTVNAIPIPTERPTEQEHFPTTLVIVASVTVIVLVGAVLLVYFKKHRNARIDKQSEIEQSFK
jgi:uncharacterized membrane protein YraQ (UPF0718 family)